MFWRGGTKENFAVASDAELIDKLADDDRAAFAAFYSRYSKLIYYTVRSVERDLADDIFQDFFLRLQDTRFRALRMWNRSLPLSGFLRQVVRNFALDRLRKEKTGPRTGGSNEIESLELESGDISAQEVLEMRETRKGAIRAWAQLPSARDRRLICGKYYRDTSSGAGATREGLTPGAYRKALFDAQRRFMALVKASIPDYLS